MNVDVSHYVDAGYLIVPRLVSADDVARCRDEVVAFARGDYAISNPPALAPDASDDDLLCSILAVHFPHWVSPVALAMLRHDGIVDVLRQIVAAHVPHWDGRVKAMQSMLFVKPPQYPGQAWHQDEFYIPTRDRSLCGAWICLDDADVDNGCLWVLPGSHRDGFLWPTRGHDNPDEFDGAHEAFGFDDREAVPVEVAAGDVVFFNGYLLHRSRKNRSVRFRRALVNHYMNAWSLLPWDPTGVGLADNRCVVPVWGDDPYAKVRPLVPAPATAFIRPAQ